MGYKLITFNIDWRSWLETVEMGKIRKEKNYFAIRFINSDFKANNMWHFGNDTKKSDKHAITLFQKLPNIRACYANVIIVGNYYF